MRTAWRMPTGTSLRTTRRPVGEGFVLVGFKEAEWEQALLG